MMMQLPGCPGRGFIPAMNSLVFSAGNLYKLNYRLKTNLFCDEVAASFPF
jgi:hypothetical protein